jgi:hypothetical protein
MKHASDFLRIAAPTAVIALFSLGVAVATGAIPSSEDGQIYGCYAKPGGSLRVIDAERDQTCRASEEPISWSQQGPTGPQGLQGPQGEPGSSGSGPAFWAVVRGATGELFRGSNVASTVRNHAGSYSIVFDESIPGQSGERPGCAVNVTPTQLEGDFTTRTGVTPITYTGSPTTIHVETYQAGTTVDQSFSLAVSC